MKGGEGRNVKEGEGRTDINEERKECEGGKEGHQQRNAKKTGVSVGAVLCCNHSPTSSHSTHTPHPKLDPPTDPPASATPRVCLCSIFCGATDAYTRCDSDRGIREVPLRHRHTEVAP